MANVGSMTALVCLLTTYCGCETARCCSDKAFAISFTGTGRTRGINGVTFGTDCVVTGVG